MPAMMRAVTDLLVCLVIQILVVTGIGGAAHSGTMAAERGYALCGTGGPVEAPDAAKDRHCLDCVVGVAGLCTPAAQADASRIEVAADTPPDLVRIASEPRPGARRIRAPPASSEADF
jgi:hypothetical protein